MSAHPNLESLRRIALDSRATPDLISRAVNLAYELGRTEGYHRGKLEGIEEMHAGALKALRKEPKP
jgi:hypothetical protein